MLQSMTGFARGSVAAGPITVTVELRSVNSRFLDLHFKLPDGLRALESGLRARLGKRFSRGKLEVMVRWSEEAASGAPINEQRLTELLGALNGIANRLEPAAPVDPLALLLAPGVLAGAGADESVLSDATLSAADAAIEELSQQRRQEGEALAVVIRERAATMRTMLTALRERLPELRQLQRQRILDRIRDAGVEPDGKRLEEELVYIAQRADVDEEMDRIDTHLDAIELALGSGKPCGRRLDFLMQELNREANTLSSKSTALTTTNTSVEFKLLIEQMREQIQNLE